MCQAEGTCRADGNANFSYIGDFNDRPIDTPAPTRAPTASPTRRPTGTLAPTATNIPPPTPTGSILRGDLNGDGVVNITDLVIVGANFGTAGARGDANGDEKVDVIDLVLVGANFGNRR